MNNQFTINRELGSGKHVGVNTVYPQATLDIRGSFFMNHSSFLSSLVVGRPVNTTPTWDITINGSTYMQSLFVNVPASMTRVSQLDVFMGGGLAVCRGNNQNSNVIASTIAVINNCSMWPSPNPENNGLTLYWNNGPGGQGSSLQ